MVQLPSGSDDMYSLSRCQTLLCGRVQDLEWEVSPRFPFCNCVISLPYVDCDLCQAWTSDGQFHSLVNLRIVSLDNVARKHTTSSHSLLCALLFHHSNAKQKLIHSSQELNIHSCQWGSCTCLLGKAKDHGNSVCGAESGFLAPSHRYINPLVGERPRSLVRWRAKHRVLC